MIQAIVSIGDALLIYISAPTPQYFCLSFNMATALAAALVQLDHIDGPGKKVSEFHLTRSQTDQNRRIVQPGDLHT